MSTHLLTPAMAGLLSRIQRAQRTPFHALSVADARRAYAVGAEVLDLPRVPLARIEDFSLPAADGTPLPARLYADTHQPVPALLYLHGGGFVIGGLETHDSLCRQLARRSGGAAAARWWRWTTGVRPNTRSRPRSTTPGQRCAPWPQGPLISAWPMPRWPWAATAPAARWRRCAPCKAEVDGVAPACMIMAECDRLVDEGLAYADQLRAAGVAVELELYRGLTHDFIKMGRTLKEASFALDVAAAALRNAWVACAARR